MLTILADARKLHEKIKKKGGGDLIGIRENLVDLVWGSKKPARPKEKVTVLSTDFAGKQFQEKIEDLREELEKKKVAGFIVCKLLLEILQGCSIQRAANVNMHQLPLMRSLGCSTCEETSQSTAS